MKKLVKPFLVGLACGGVSFPLSAWGTFWILLHYHGFDQVPIDRDYHAAIAVGSWACFVQAVVCGIVVGLTTIVLVTRYLYRRDIARLPASSVPVP